MNRKKVARALVSVYDKTGLVELGKALKNTELKFSQQVQPQRYCVTLE